MGHSSKLLGVGLRVLLLEEGDSLLTKLLELSLLLDQLLPLFSLQFALVMLDVSVLANNLSLDLVELLLLVNDPRVVLGPLKLLLQLFNLLLKVLDLVYSTLGLQFLKLLDSLLVLADLVINFG